jgi:Predicted signal transduction protein with a C-terminal ATPase domain
MNRFLTFKQKLILTYMVFIVLPMSVLGLGAYRLYSDAMEKKVSDFAQQVAVSTASNIEMYIAELEQFTLMPYYNPDFQDMLTENKDPDPLLSLEVKKTVEKNFSFWQSQRDSVENISYFSKPGVGRERIYNLGYLPPDLEVDKLPWFESFDGSDDIVTYLSLHQPAPTDLIQNTPPPKVFSLIRRIYQSSTILITSGYFQVDFTLEDIERIMSRVNREKNASYLLMDKEGQIVYAGDPVDERLLPHIVELPSDVPSRQIVNTGNQKHIVVHHPVGKMGWTVVGYVPVSQIVSGIIQVRNSMILIGAVCIAFALIVSTGISYQITKPIYKLISLIKRVETEDFQIQYDNPPRNEIGQLIRSFIRMSRRLDETIRNLYQAEIVRQESELRALKSQINPHFLFNTLETIKMKAEIDEADGTVDMITALGKLVKTSLHAGNDFNTFREEREYLINYFYIQENRYASRFDMTIDVEEGLLDWYIPKLLIQPLVENAFYHGLEMKQGKGKLSVSIAREGACVKVAVTDDGLGIPPERLLHLRHNLDDGKQRGSQDERSIGLANVSARIRLYFGSPYTMRIDSLPGEGTEVVLLLPPIKSESEVNIYVSRHNR